MKKKDEIKIGISLLIAILIVFPLVSSNYIGISPAKISIDNVLRGGYSEKTVMITTDTQTPVEVEIQPRGEIMEWLNFSSEKFQVSKDKPYNLRISVMPPTDVPNGNYSGFLRFKTVPTGEGKEGYATGIVQTVLDLSINVEITDLEILDCSALDFEISSAEKGDKIILKTNVLNKGNIRIKPTIRVDIWDEEQMKIIKTEEFSNTQILPTIKGTITSEISSQDLEVGQYWAEISVIECYSSSTLTFDVLEVGSLKSLGELTKISAPPWSNVGDTLMIQAYFKNTGEKKVDATFKGTLTLEGKIVEILESETSEVEMNSEEIFKFYFTPKKQGRYIITGRVFYDKKRTFEKSAIFNVVKKNFSFFSLLTYFLYSIVIVGIIVLIYKIRKEREKIENKLRQIRR